LAGPGDRTIDYLLGIGVSGAGSGWQHVAEEEGSTVAAALLTSLRTIECRATAGGLEAELEYADDGDQRLAITFANGTDPDAVRWSGPLEATGAIASLSSTSTGVVVTGAIDSGTDELVGRPFSVAVVGCEEG
jgi:hypothetical protein